MAKKSALTVKQWNNIEVRFYADESASSLASEYGVTEGAIRKKYGTKKKQAKELANQIVGVETELNKYDFGTKCLARTFADKMLALQELAGDIAYSGMRTAKRISEAAKTKAEKLTDEELHDPDTMRALMASGIAANTHAKTGMDILTLASKPNALKTPEDEAKITRIERVIVNGTIINQ